ncbi:MAG: HD domain-containing protein [Chloroflexota bacterium]|nr:HD domain-containing protein [Chloroflexota bacterium]
MSSPPEPESILDPGGFDGTPIGPALLWLRRQPEESHLVGGSVRDLLLGRPIGDLDVVVETGGQELARRLADVMGGAYVGLDTERDIGRAILRQPAQGLVQVDVAAWRADTLVEDLLLRDFTVNAMAVSLAHGPSGIIDPSGGLADTAQRFLRLVSDTALADDPLRSLRAIRLVAELSSLGFRLESETARRVQRASPALATCADERVRDELVKILSVDRPGQWVAEMGDYEQLDVLLPELERTHGVLQSPPHHLDVFDHSLLVVDMVSWHQALIDGCEEPRDEWDLVLMDVLAEQLELVQEHFSHGEGAGLRSRGHMLRWAALGHDLGKPTTAAVKASSSGETRIRFLGHERVGADLISDVLRRLRFNDAEVRRVASVVAHHLRPLQLASASGPPSRKAVHRYFRDLGDAGIDVAMLSLADFRAKRDSGATLDDWLSLLGVVEGLLDDFWQRPEQVVSPPALVDGRDLMETLNLPPGPLIGQLLEKIAEQQAVGTIQTGRQALDYALRQQEEHGITGLPPVGAGG